PVEHAEQVAHRVGAPVDVAHVGVLGDEAQGALLAAAADHDARAVLLDRARDVLCLLDPVVLAGEARSFLREHRPADLQRLFETVEALTSSRELEAEAVVLLLVPRRADAEDRPPARDDVQRRDHLRQERRVPVRHAGHERAELRAGRARRQPTQQRVALEHRLGRAPEGRQLPKVVHDPERLESRLLACFGEPGDVLEHLVVGHARGCEGRELKAERGHCSILSRTGPVPSPPPQHIVTSASLLSPRASWWRAVVTRRAPVAPTGCPMAMAPPLGFTRSMSGLSSRSHASTTEANASLISIVSMSDIAKPVRSNSRRVASIGPVSISTGSTPTRHSSTKRARGRRLSSLAFAAVISSTAAAPSVICDDDPAVCTRSARATGLSAASASRDVSRRPSSRSTRCVVPAGLPSSSRSGASMGTTSPSNRPSCHARCARSCEASPKRSHSSRVIP